MRRVAALLVPWLLGGALPPPASSQGASPSLQEQINAAARIRVLTATGRGEVSRPQLVGDSIVFVTGSVLSARSGRRTTLASPLPLAAVSEIAVPAGSSVGEGVLIGGGIGALLGLVLLIGASADESTSSSTTGDLSELKAAAVTTALGAGIGALLGAASPKWRVVYPVPTGAR